jgi:hypothetical protein
MSYSLGASLTIRPANTLRISINPDYSNRSNQFQYVAQRTYSDQDRYLFGKIDQKVLSMSLRINYTIIPDLTIQYWGQPFIATGEYSSFKMITDPGAGKLSDRYYGFTSDQVTQDNGFYSIDENSDGIYDYEFGVPDFNIGEWLSNLVIRWEFMPGSTAYLVWSQSRDYSQSSGEYQMWNNLDELFTNKKANDVFLLKISYRFGLR